MAINPLKAFLFASGGAVAVAGTAYVSGALDPLFSPQPPAQVAALQPPAQEPSGQTAAPGTTDRLAKTPSAGTGAAEPAKTDTQPAAEAAAPAAPTFDVVRVEGDGSVVIAGNAAPKARVEALNGGTVLGSAEAGPDGAFAIVLDTPLKPGDYQITLRATQGGGTPLTSAQTAVVSIPQKPDGQVLAMVEEPGKPAALLTVPEPGKKPEAQAEAPAQPAETTQPADAVPPAPAARESTTEAAAEPAQPAEAAAPAAMKPATTEAPSPAAPGARVAVEAVEIDGGKVFVAGIAEAGRKVRAYANEILLGDATTSPDGHFLVEASRDLPVGTYNVRVDALDADGATVVARATVPFEREPGEAIAAVAPSAPTTEKATEAEPAPSSEAAAQPAPATGKPAETAAAAPSAEGVAETVSPKLEHADSAVIIRRHDTLWRISRRVYGHGIRYSTIYLANQDQISDPDRIWPGQVFKLPEKSREGEAADMTVLGDQMTTAPAKAE